MLHERSKVYTNVYLFEKNIRPLQVQKHNRELEAIIQECIVLTIRESIPAEKIICSYTDESVKHEEVVIENIEEPVVLDGEESYDCHYFAVTVGYTSNFRTNIDYIF